MGEAIGVVALIAALAGVYLIGRARQRELDRQREDAYKRKVKADQSNVADVPAATWRERLRERARRLK